MSRLRPVSSASPGNAGCAVPRNVEIKARVSDLATLEGRVAALSTGGPQQLVQHDTFFRTAGGRLKLRRFGDGNAELIQYRRPDSTAPAASEYQRVVIHDPEPLAALLSAALGVRGEVKKTRILYWIGQTRVHLDRVEGLGAFMELEVTLSATESVADGQDIALALMEKLGVDEADLVDRAYLDLLPVPAA